MTEAEWLRCIEPKPMLRFLCGKGGDRKWQLFACACCERIEHLLGDARSRSAIAVLRRAADGRADAEELTREVRGARYAKASAIWAVCVPILGEAEYVRLSRQMRTGPDPFERMAEADPAFNAAFAVELAIGCADPAMAAWRLRGGQDPAAFAADAAGFAAQAAACASQDLTIRPREWAAQCDLLRDLFGNPFRCISVLPVWRTATVVSIAQRIYDLRDFAGVGVLADALEDAACDNADVLNHCRQPGEHVRGCWVVDLLTGRN